MTLRCVNILEENVVCLLVCFCQKDKKTQRDKSEESAPWKQMKDALLPSPE